MMWSQCWWWQMVRLLLMTMLMTNMKATFKMSMLMKAMLIISSIITALALQGWCKEEAQVTLTSQTRWELDLYTWHSHVSQARWEFDLKIHVQIHLTFILHFQVYLTGIPEHFYFSGLLAALQTQTLPSQAPTPRHNWARSSKISLRYIRC